MRACDRRWTPRPKTRAEPNRAAGAEAWLEATLEAPRSRGDATLSPPIGGLAGTTAGRVSIVTIWILPSNDAAPRFVTAYPLE